MRRECEQHEYRETIEAEVLLPPKIAGGVQILQTRVTGFGCESERTLILESSPKYEYSDVLVLQLVDFSEKVIYFPVVIELGEGNRNPILVVVYSMRVSIMNSVRALFVEPHASLVAGIVFGLEQSLGNKLSNQVRDVGLMHVVVASGYNITVVISYIAVLGLWLRHELVIALTLLGIGVYAAIAGFDPPILRAAIMGFATIFAVGMGRQRDSYLWLIYSAILLTMWDPILILSLSFQLSFGATLGILLFYEFWSARFFFLPRMFRSDLATTVAVQVITIPILWITLGVFQIKSIIVNMIVLWSIPLIFLVSIISILMSSVSITMARVLAFPAFVMLEYILFVVEVFSK